MNKTIDINLGGYFFHIDEIAYYKLKNYLDNIAKSLQTNSEEEKKEILNDIEARISELLLEKMSDKNQVVNSTQIDNIIVRMGQPEAYGEIKTDDLTDNPITATQKNNHQIKKLFRDGDHRFIGGVCSGLAYYIGIDSIWIRLSFIVLIASGFPFLLYIILWILVPMARTTSDKLQMQGAPVNIDNIEKKIKESFSDTSKNIKNGVSEISEQISNGNYEQLKGKAKTGLQEIGIITKNILKTLLKISGKLLALFLILISGTVIIALSFMLFSLGKLDVLTFNGKAVNLYPDMFLDSSLPNWLLVIASFIGIIIPAIALFILGIQILSSNVKKIKLPVQLSMLSIWIISLFILLYAKFESESLSAFQGIVVSKQNILSATNEPLEILVVNDNDIYYPENLKRKNNAKKVIIDKTEKKYSNNVKINVKKSETAKNYIEIIRESKGKNPKQAKNNADNIAYKFEMVDNKLIFDAYFLSHIKDLKRDEETRITVYVTENTTVFFQNSSKYFLFDIDNTENIKDVNMANHQFKMSSNGLQCLDCDIEDENNDTEEEKKSSENNKQI